jgi:hypothetical protein
MRRLVLSTVMPGLVRASTSLQHIDKRDVDGPDKPGHDDWVGANARHRPCSLFGPGWPVSLFPFPQKRGMERREAPGACEAPRGRALAIGPPERAVFQRRVCEARLRARAPRSSRFARPAGRVLRLPALHLDRDWRPEHGAHCRRAGPAFPPARPRDGRREKSRTRYAYIQTGLLSRTDWRAFSPARPREGGGRKR